MKKFVLLVAVAALAVVLSGCASGGAPVNCPPPNQNSAAHLYQ